MREGITEDKDNEICTSVEGSYNPNVQIDEQRYEEKHKIHQQRQEQLCQRLMR